MKYIRRLFHLSIMLIMVTINNSAMKDEGKTSVKSLKSTFDMRTFKGPITFESDLYCTQTKAFYKVKDLVEKAHIKKHLTYSQIRILECSFLSTLDKAIPIDYGALADLDPSTKTFEKLFTRRLSFYPSLTIQRTEYSEYETVGAILIDPQEMGTDNTLNQFLSLYILRLYRPSKE